MTDTICTTTHHGIVTVTLNRPHVRNALRLREFDRLIQIVDTVADDPELRVLLLTGTGETFCAGGDLKESATLGPEELAEHPVHRLTERLTRFPKVLIAAVHGAAAGFGATMLLHADAVVAGPLARIATPFASLGVPAEAGSSLLLPAIAGPRVAARMLLFGERIGAAEAHACGLVSHLVDGDREAVVASAQELATAIVAMPAGAVESNKHLLRAAHEAPLQEALRRERTELSAMLPRRV
ncbi:enoyl-CoA hydratase/isomerase family protein [Mycolicibacterium sphagni]|nr:enoyl-CoA hydratase-related protein [Mycolicibacterium sphagni]